MPEYEIPLKKIPQGPPPQPPPRNVPMKREFADRREENHYETLSDHMTTRRSEERPRGPTLKIARPLLLISVLFALGFLFYYFLSSSSSSSPDTKKIPVSVKNHKQPQLTKSKSLEYCPTGYTWFEQTNYCYKATTTPASFENAESTCQSDGAHLTSIHSEVEGVFVSGLYHNSYLESSSKSNKRTKHNYLIGLHRPNGTWQWMDGSHVDYTHWYSESSSTGNSSVAIGHTGTKWFLTSARDYGFVCKQPSKMAGGSMETSIPSQSKSDARRRKCILGYYWFEATGSCYMISTRHINFADANQSCKSDNASLVSIHSETENILLNGLIMKTLEDTNQLEEEEKFWIGLTVKNRKYEWTDGSLVGFVDWHGSEPTYVRGVDMFLCTYWKAWQPAEPSLENGFICKMEESL